MEKIPEPTEETGLPIDPNEDLMYRTADMLRQAARGVVEYVRRPPYLGAFGLGIASVREVLSEAVQRHR